MQDLAITAKRLGIPLLDIYCPGSLWFLLRIKFHCPWAPPGGALWTDMECCQRELVHTYLKDDGCLPEQFAPFCDLRSPIEYPRHWSKFGYLHDSGVWLYGSPDDIYDHADDTLCVVDHKSAHNRGDDDRYLPMYKVQVVGYGNIAEYGLNLGKVSRGGIFYWDIHRDAVVTAPKKYVRNGALCPPFIPKPIEVEMDYTTLDAPLKEIKRLWKSKTPPACNGKDKDCELLKALFAIEQQVSEEDRMLLRGLPHYQDHLSRSTHRRLYSLFAALSDLPALDDDTPGVLSAWNL